MKNLSLILNAVLLVLVGYLYYAQFSGKKSDAAPTMITPANLDHSIKIAYVDSDTLTAKYEWLNTQKKALEKRLKDAESAVSSKEAGLAKEMQDFQVKSQAGTTPPAQLEQEYNSLMKRAQALEQEKVRLTQKLSEEETRTYKEMMSNLETQLKSLQSQIGYDYILSYSKGGGQVLLANDSLDITKQVLDLLNAKQQ